MSRSIGIKKSILNKERGPLECKKCTLDILCDLVAGRDAYKKTKMAFLASRDEWNQNRSFVMELAIFGHVKFPKTHNSIDLELL